MNCCPFRSSPGICCGVWEAESLDACPRLNHDDMRSDWLACRHCALGAAVADRCHLCFDCSHSFVGAFLVVVGRESECASGIVLEKVSCAPDV